MASVHWVLWWWIIVATESPPSPLYLVRAETHPFHTPTPAFISSCLHSPLSVSPDGKPSQSFPETHQLHTYSPISPTLLLLPSCSVATSPSPEHPSSTFSSTPIPLVNSSPPPTSLHHPLLPRIPAPTPSPLPRRPSSPGTCLTALGRIRRDNAM